MLGKTENLIYTHSHSNSSFVFCRFNEHEHDEPRIKKKICIKR
jgi:hypothetical protein